MNEADVAGKWLRRLRRGDAAVRALAAMRLTASGVDLGPVMEELRAAVGDADAEVARLAAWVLARAGRGEAA